MSSNTLTEKITNDAQAAADAIAEEAKADVAAIERETTATLERLQAEAATRLEKAKEHETRIGVAKATQAGKLALQQAKRDHIDSVFAEVTERIRTLEASEYVAFFTAHSKAILPETVTAVTVTGPVTREQETVEIANALDLTATFTPGTMLAGLMVTATDGVYDITLDRLLEERRAELEVAIVRQATGS